jgi:hypothetical protein
MAAYHLWPFRSVKDTEDKTRIEATLDGFLNATNRTPLALFSLLAMSVHGGQVSWTAALLERGAPVCHPRAGLSILAYVPMKEYDVAMNLIALLFDHGARYKHIEDAAGYPTQRAFALAIHDHRARLRSIGMALYLALRRRFGRLLPNELRREMLGYVWAMRMSILL